MPFLKRATNASKRASIIDGMRTDNGGRGGSLLHDDDDAEAELEVSLEDEKLNSEGGEEQRDLGLEDG